MEDNGRIFLERELNKAKEAYLAGFEVIRQAQNALTQAKIDYDAMSNALTSYTRSSDNPYTPEPLPSLQAILSTVDPSMQTGSPLLRSSKARIVVRAPGVKKGKPLDLSLNSKAGILRNALEQLAGDITIDRMLGAMPGDTAIKVSRGDLHRMLPRFVYRGELIRDGNIYRKPDERDDRTLFAGG